MEKKYGILAKEFLEKWVAEHRDSLTIEVEKEYQDGFGRVLGRLVSDG